MAPTVACITTVDLSLRFLAFDLLVHQKNSGYQVFGISAEGPFSVQIRDAGINVISVPMTRRVTPFQDLFSLWRLWRVLRVIKPDIVHTHTPKANLLGQIAARMAGVPIRVETIHGLYFTPKSPRWRQLLFGLTEWLSAMFPHAIFLINEDDYNTMLHHHLCNPKKLRFLIGGMGVSLQRFDPAKYSSAMRIQQRTILGIPANALVIGFVGRMVVEKGLLALYAAFGTLIEDFPNAWLLLVGPHDIDKPDAISPDRVNQYGIADRCTFTGLCEDVENLYTLMDIFVLPSYREGLSVSAMEAQAMGVPVVTTDARGCHDSIDPGVTGLLFPAGDVESLTQCLRQLLANPAQRKDMGEAGRRLAASRFDQRLMFEAIDREYQRLLAAPFD